MKQYIRKADIILLIVLIIVGLASTAYVAMSRTGGDTVIIEQNGKMYAKYSLFEDRSVTIEGKHSTNIVTIKGGQVWMEESTCKNQVCVRHSKISAGGESIICLPNRVVVRVEGKGGGYDAVTS
ncbi:MAG: NusG domain II-containing protein [Clostridiales bacterium]|nr:NusG domain II-containing protein [Candidatus Crickella equi]